MSDAPSGFDQLHPALQHHIVNSLGWTELREFQDSVIPRVLAGDHLIVLAPTAGGKTEAAIFPVLSRMLDEEWSGLSVLYVCPIKALLNNLDARLQRYAGLLGRRSALWHGDVGQGDRRRVQQDPPDILLTTPESVEVMLTSGNVDSNRLLGNIRVVIVDEVHAFAGDDRGWHLLAVLDRIAKLSGAHQRIGLSATVGNPDTLVEWLAGNCDGQRTVFQPPPGTADAADVTLDYVGSLQNAAHVISRLHRGEKRLVFVDSRSRAEQLGKQLAELDVTTFVTHSSLSQEQRHQAEEAFASRDNCVIVSTSALELGIDVGDLDRVIQIDSPPSVSSFLQRMGRTGRRSDTTRNCLFLATKEEALIQAAGLIDLWAEGYVEPIVPPLSPLHIAAQQVMALALQQQGIARDQIHNWIAGFSRTAELSREQLDELVDWMLAQAILSEDNGLVWLGHEGESAFGRRNFSELFSVFTSPPLFTVLHGRRELGFVDQLSFLGQHRGPRVLLLGGRSWRVTHIDWGRRHAFVEATDERGSTRWSGQGQGLSYRLCQSIKAVVGSQTTRDDWSQRACDQISETRDSFWWVDPATTTVISSGSKGPEWWTFGGNLVNSPLAATLERESGQSVQVSNLAITIESGLESSELRAAIERTLATDIDEFVTPIDDEAIEGLKFSECLPTEQATELLQRRLIDRPALSHIIEMNVAYAAPEAR